MPERTVAIQYYTEKDGTIHPFGSKPDLSDEEAKRGDDLAAFEESEKDPSEVGGVTAFNNLNVQTPATHAGREGLTGTRTVVPELEDSEPAKDEDLPQDPENEPGGEADPDEKGEDGEVSKKAARKRRSKSEQKPAEPQQPQEGSRRV